MESTRHRASAAQPRGADQSGAPAPKKRFRIEKLEERIAPKKGGSKGSGGSGSGGVTIASGGSGTIY